MIKWNKFHHTSDKMNIYFFLKEVKSAMKVEVSVCFLFLFGISCCCWLDNHYAIEPHGACSVFIFAFYSLNLEMMMTHFKSLDEWWWRTSRRNRNPCFVSRWNGGPTIDLRIEEYWSSSHVCGYISQEKKRKILQWRSRAFQVNLHHLLLLYTHLEFDA